MSYTAHNFTNGHKLKASELNQMDNKILEHETEISRIEDLIAAQPGEVSEKIRKLSLSSDSLNAYLYYDEELLSTIQFPSTPTGVVPCTGLSAIQSGLNIGTGGTETISLTKQPSDCTQNPRFISSNPGIASVASTGTVTGISAGNCTVTAFCGGQSASVPVVVAQRYNPTGRLSQNAYYSTTYSQLEAQFVTGSSDSRVYFGPEENMAVPPGATVSVVINLSGPDPLDHTYKGIKLNAAGLLLPDSGGFIYQNDGAVVKGVSEAILIPKSAGPAAIGGNGGYYGSFSYCEGFTYTNNTDDTLYLFLNAIIVANSEDYEGTRDKAAVEADIAFVKSNMDILVTMGGANSV